MSQLAKVRIAGLAISLVCAGLIWHNWQQLLAQHSFSLRVAGLGPAGLVLGLFLVFCPERAGPPQNTRDKWIVVAVAIAGLALGLLNLYLMHPAMFGLDSR